jgi:serine/threonine-protein kinase
MHPQALGDRRFDHVGRFQREARAAAAIDNDHVARVLDWGTDPLRGTPYMVMEYLEGEDLQALLRRAGALRPETALRILAQACLGVQKAHEARVIHRDIKPANLFLAKTGGGAVVVKILDFGIAKIRPESEGGETTGLTRTGGMLGSPIYMSPEQARGLKAIDHRTDIWSLGIVLYRALSGRTPHEDTEALGDLIISICSAPPRPVQEIAPWVPASAASVTDGALQLHPDDRWPSAAAMFEAIRPLLPAGWALGEDMLVTVDQATRAVVAPRAPERITTGSGRRTISTGNGTPPPLGVSTGASTSSLALAEDDVPASTAASGRHNPSWQARAAVAAVVASLSAGGVFYAATAIKRVPPGPAPPGPASSVPAGAEGERGSPPSTTTTTRGDPSYSSAQPVVPAPMLHVKLAVSPRDAAVEIDGAAVPVRDGAVDVEGAAGSVHRIRVARGALETSVDVVVTDGGAVPPRIELGVLHPAATTKPSQAGWPASPGPQHPSSTAAPPSTKPLIPDRFE